MNIVQVSRGRLARRAVLAGIASLACITVTVAAQVGNLGRRAREAAARAAGVEQPAGEQVTFDSVTLELTAARLDQVMKGLRAGKAVLDGGRGRPSWRAMAERRDAAANEAAEIEQQQETAFAAFTERQSAVSQCRESEFYDISQMRRQERMQQAMSDPNLAMRFAQMAQAVQEAQARGDTAEVARLAREMDVAFGGPTRADSQAVDRKCGPIPATPAAMLRRNALRALTDTLNDSLRAVEIRADSVTVRGSGLTAAQMAMARERVEMYIAQEGEKHSGFTSVELVALAAKRDELAALL